MLVLGRGQGEQIEIEGYALIRVARIEDKRVRLDVTAPLAQTRRGEQEEASPSPRTVVISLLNIRRAIAGKPQRTKIGVRVPQGAKVRRGEVAIQTLPAHRRFPWTRFRPTARYWRSINEEIHISLP